MAEVLGALNILDRALPTGVDGDRLARWALRDGVTYQDLINQTSLALAEFNQSLVDQWGWSFFITEELMMEYEQGGSVNAMPELTDQDRPEPIHGETIGHMLDLKYYGRAIGGSRKFFRDIRSAKLRSSISAVVRAARWRFEIQLLNRLLTNTENPIGAAGYDVPFVRGAGGNVDFIPPPHGGEEFTSSHDHFLGIDSDNDGFDDMLVALAEHLIEHGHQPPFDALVSFADLTDYHALEDFVEYVNIANLVIDRGGGTSGNAFFAAEQLMMQGGHFGDYKSPYGIIRLRMNQRIPTGYAGMYKSGGTNVESNPIAVRVHPEEGFGCFVVPETTQDVHVPIKQLDVEMEFGISVGMDRTNGAAAFLDSSGNWSNPSIT